MASVNSRAAMRGMTNLPSERLLGGPGERNAELTRFAVQVWTLDAERLRGVGHAPAVMLEDGGDVIVLEALPRLAQRAFRRETRRRALEPQRRQQCLDLNVFGGRRGDGALDRL